MWVHIGNQITPEWPFGDLVCKVNTFIQVIAVTLSVLSLTTISADRFMAIVFPLRSRMSSTKASIVISMIWFISISVAAPQLIVRHQSEFTWADRHEIYCDEVWPTVYINTKCETDQPVRKIYYIIFILVLYFIPILVMIVAYSIIVLTLMKRKAPGVAILSTTLAQEKSKRKVIKMLIVVLIVFILCWSPQQILLLWGLFRSKKQFPAYIETVRFVALYVAYLNSSLNPILYCGFNENFRKGFIDAFRCSFSKKTLRIFPMRNIERTSSGIGERHSSRCRSIQERPHTEVSTKELTRC
ncbi:neuropeptide FF receptor 2-like [Octopus vulgaris]|uniref:Neuropeptide FF receptor 2-like n=1 Tax=Octopus vulgaris TaxID=6645 RepID=A0AA36F6F5_OCTVU|nr:neuropeptide FF receptor 2-like [Octopus vulgaris]